MGIKKMFSASVVKEIGYYVYLYSHPVTGEIFYVGKGNGNRVFSHLDDESESNKTNVIKELMKQNIEPKIEILVHGLDSDTALRVESSIIDLLGVGNLTNVQSGYLSSKFGRMSPEQLTSIYSKDCVEIVEPSILIRVNRLFRHNMSSVELYDVTRSSWRLKLENAKKSKYAFAIYQGVIQEVYEILGWYAGGSTLSSRVDLQENCDDGASLESQRYEFVGNIAPKDIRNKYLLKSIKEDVFKSGNSNPVMYVNHD